jgi:4-amino-4-deoxy-L-arabinose transferase-like glycosyltransferase
VVALPLLLARAGLVGLAEPSEARYGQIAREMAEGGSWLVPTWQGVPHLEKPPLAYWPGALGIRLFGRHELALRLGSVVALVLSAVLSSGIARRVAGPRAAAPAALAMLTAPLTVAFGTVLMTDPLVLAAATLFHYSVVRRLEEGTPWALDVAALALAAGLLAKGHMIFLFTVLPMALAGTGVFRELWRPRRILLILAIAAPWFLRIEWFGEPRFPGFFREQGRALLGRAGGSGHRAPFFIYALALGLGFLPYLLYVPRGLGSLLPPAAPSFLGRWRATPPETRLLLLWLLAPFLVLTAVQSRLPTYILPATPPLAILAAARLGALDKAWRPVAVSMVVVLGIVLLARFDEDLFEVKRGFARDVARLSKELNAPIVVAGMSLPSMGFYSDDPVTTAGESGPLAREAEAWGRSPLFTPETDLGKLLTEDLRSVIVVKEKVRAKLAPWRRPALVEDGIAVLLPTR